MGERLASLAPGAALGSYQIVRRLGAGGMGEVYLASDPELDRFVAIKRLHSELAARLETDARFRQEARLLSRLSHPNIVVIHAFGAVPPDLHYIVMEYVAGETLEERLARQGPLDPASFCHVMMQVCGAIAEAHRHGIIHRDIKPANVLLTAVAGEDQFVKVVDFGVAKTFGDVEGGSPGETRQGAFLGTPYYSPPEQIRGEAIDRRTDVYALAVMGCELLTGCRPFEGQSIGALVAAHLEAPPPPPSSLRPDLGITPAVDAVFQRALEKRPDRRHDRVEAFEEELVTAVCAWAGLPPVRWSVAPRSMDRGSERPSLPSDVVVQVSMQPGPRALAQTFLKPQELRVAHHGTVLQLELPEDPGIGGGDRDEHMDCLAHVASKMRTLVERGRGRVVGPLTDHLTAVFGLDDHHDADPEAALDAALALQSVLRGLPADPTVPSWFKLPFRIGVDTGRVLLVETDDGAVAYQGAPVFEARRLAQACDSGEISTSNAVYRRVRGLYDTELVSTRGAGQDVAPRRVLGKKSTSNLEPAPLHGVRIDVIGRERELARVRDAVALVARDRSPRAIWVTGPAGIGKSRLVQELMREIEDRPGETYFFESGRCTVAWQGLPYEPFIQAIRRRARIREDDRPEQARMKLEHMARRFFVEPGTSLTPDDRALLDRLRDFLGLGDPTATGSQGQVVSVALGEEAHRKLLFDAVTEVLRRLAARHPVIFLFEDFEWATGPTKDLLGHMLEWLGPAPVLFVIATRTEVDGAPDTSFVRDPGKVDRVDLAPLDPDASEQLIRHMLRGLVEVPAGLVRQIAAIAEGVPLIVEEAIHDLIDDAAIVVEDSHWRLATHRTASLGLPSTVEQLFLGRVQRLDAGLRDVLEVASVTGRRFWPALLSHLSGRPVPPLAIVELVHRGFLVARRDIVVMGELDYAFSQLATQEAVYRGLPTARRRSLHLAAAKWLERQGRGPVAQHDDAIGFHFREAGEPSRALPHARRAADRAIRTCAIDEAVRQLQTCLELLAEIAPSQLPRDQWVPSYAGVSADLTHQLVLAGNLQRAVEVANSGAAELSEHVASASRELARASVWKGWALEHLGRFADASEAFATASTMLGGASLDILALQAATGEVQAGFQTKADARDAIGRLVGALARAPVSSENPEWDRARSAARRVLANRELHKGNYPEAERGYQGAYDDALGANAPVEIVDALNCLAALHYFRGDLATAEVNWRMALEEAERWDLTQHRAVLLANLGELEIALGRPDAAKATLGRAQALDRYLGSDRGLAETNRNLAECCLLLGEIDEARAQAEAALVYAQKTGSPYYLGFVHRVLAKIAHAEAEGTRPARAADIRRHLDESIRAFETGGNAAFARESRELADRLCGAT